MLASFWSVEDLPLTTAVRICSVLSNDRAGNMNGFLGIGGYAGGIEVTGFLSAGFYILYVVVTGVMRLLRTTSLGAV